MNVPAMVVGGNEQRGAATCSFQNRDGYMHAHICLHACRNVGGPLCESNHARVLCSDAGGGCTFPRCSPTLWLFPLRREKLFFQFFFLNFFNGDIMSAPKICSPSGNK